MSFREIRCEVDTETLDELQNAIESIRVSTKIRIPQPRAVGVILESCGGKIEEILSAVFNPNRKPGK